MKDGRGPGGAAYDALVDGIDHDRNPSDEECWHCGGEGYLSDCHDEFGCIDPESGCEECMRRCPECVERARDRLKAIRMAVIEANNVDIAIAWLISIGRWKAGITREKVQADLDKERAKLAAPAPAEG